MSGKVAALVGALALVVVIAPRLRAPRATPPVGVAAKGTPASAPAYQIVDVPGIKGLLRKAQGHVLLVHFWASWCMPCLQELPLIERFAKEMKPRGLEVLSLSLDNPTSPSATARVAALLRKSAPHLTPNIAQFDDADELIGAVDPRWVGAIPALFAFDHQGQLRGNLLGESSHAELETLVAGLLKAVPASPSPSSVPAAPSSVPAAPAPSPLPAKPKS
jgi:thiol-disulfide isomerase/thioredoxin